MVIDSRCIDLECLCILVEEQAWEVRVDIHVLNHEGNLVDAATLAALGALCHFKRPDVTLDGRQVIIHPLDERDPVPLFSTKGKHNMHIIPLSMQFHFYIFFLGGLAFLTQQIWKNVRQMGSSLWV